MLLAALLSGCATPLAALSNQAPVHTAAGEIVVEYSDRSQLDEPIVAHALDDDAGKLERWGGLRAPVRLHLLDTHRLLEEAVNKHGYDWLRAWARYDEVFLQAPRSWSFFGATQPEIDEILLHELTHCVMYQQAGTVTTWNRKQIPMWFREGMASVSANQGYRWPTLEDLAGFMERHPELDPLAPKDAMIQNQSDLVYGAGHHAFTFLIRRYGDDSVRALLGRMYSGATFPAAFASAVGIPVDDFLADFRNYVRWRAFRYGRATHATR